MTKRKNRKPRYQVRTTKGAVEVVDTDQQRLKENAIATGHMEPTTLAKRAKATSFNIKNHDLMLERSGDPLLDTVKAGGTGWAGKATNRIESWLGESDYAWDGETAVKLSRQDIAMHEADPHDPRLPNRLSADQIDRIIYEHPSVAMEGLAKLGRILQVPMTTEADSGVHIPPFDPLELKAKVAHDLGTGRYVNLVEGKGKGAGAAYSAMTADILDESVIVDCQPVYDRWMAGATGNDMYDLRLAPPWMNALLMYNNSHGNVWAMHMVASDLQQESWSQETRDEISWQPQEPADHKVQWDQVRWVYSVQCYVGGLGAVKGPDRTLSMQQTVGPLMVWRIAVYGDGVPADIHWTHVAQDVPFHKFNNAIGALTETINMCNCVNVHVAESERRLPRAQRRRLERYGVRFSEVHIRPASKSYKGKGTPLADMARPIHGVIGHYATYGAEGRGLLFGKYAGRFWIPPHVRGSKEAGEVQQKYVAEA